MKLSRGTSLADRLAVTNVVTVGIAIMLVGVVLVAGGVAALRAMLLRQLEAQGRIAGSNCTAALAFADRDTAAKTLESLAALPDVVRVELYDREGAVFASYSRQRPRAPGGPPQKKAGGGITGLKSLAVSQPINLGGEAIGSIYIESDLSRLYSGLWNLLLFVAMLALAFILIASFLFSRLQRRLTAPFSELVAAMKTVSQSRDYTLRTSAAGVEEVNILAAGFNEMLSQIENQDTKIRRHGDYLEEQVAWRTAELGKELEARVAAETALVTAAQQWRATFDEILYAAADTKESLDVEKLAGIQRRMLSTLVYGGKWFNVTVDPVTREGGAPSGSVFIMTDTTERRALDEHLAQSQKMDAIGTLAGGVAHDFNNILSVILSYSGFLLDEIPRDSKMRPDVEEIKKSAERAAALTRQLLAFSRKQVVNPSAIVVNGLINNLSKMLKRLIGEHISMELRFDADTGMVWMDPSQLEQILVNLVVNARDAMPKGGRLLIDTKRVCVAPDNPSTFADVGPGNYVLINVTDTGTGMDKETQKRIFEPFFTTKGVGKGTGLGLSMVYGAVKQNGGFVKVYSEPGRGTAFHVYLKSHAGEGAAAAVKETAAPHGGNGELVLLVEDEEPVRRAVRKMLEANGYKVVEAANGDEGVAAFKTVAAKVSLVVSDVVMPGMGGVEMMMRLREERPGLKALHMSGYTDDMLETHGVAGQRAFVLTKPFEQRVLLAKVREILERG
ncbi:MAG: response regulator [Deltaproteobacteria bacterium]|nr:response regulator [Deltaproteobacteria bacterium]